ncbi:MAG: holo-ACP synthase [Campylobacteraceae bacterium 4484_4]|nr:MAG: holo-ACP synthase [Campylobacteraceae bacterium 4484_4]
MIGIDIVELARFERFLQRFGKRALQRYLSAEEISLVTSERTAAGFFAAKEAVAKALGTGIGKSCSFFDIRLHKEASGAPWFTLSSEIVETFKITESALSISHDGGFAIAVVHLVSCQKNHRPLSHEQL